MDNLAPGTRCWEIQVTEDGRWLRCRNQGVTWVHWRRTTCSHSDDDECPTRSRRWWCLREHRFIPGPDPLTIPFDDEVARDIAIALTADPFLLDRNPPRA